jgi:hypothetical protein
MRKITLTIVGATLIAMSAVQLAAASEQQGKTTHHRAAASTQFRNSNAYAAPSYGVQPESSGYGYGGGFSAPAGR